MTPDELREQVELQVVELLKALLEEGKITDTRAQQISQMVLNTLIPGMSFEELYQAIPRLDDTATELSPVVLPIMRAYEENVTKQAQTGVVELIRQGQYDAATKLGQQVIDKNVKLMWEGKS